MALWLDFVKHVSEGERMAKKTHKVPARGRFGKPAKGAKPPKAKKASKPRAKGPRSQALPGMGQVRNSKLDNICEGIAEERAASNAANQEEKQLTSTALQVMQASKVTAYRHAGVELSRVPGAEKLRVRLTKETGDAEVTEGKTTVAGAEDDGPGVVDVDLDDPDVFPSGEQD
jgi:hypothetical protein